MNETAFPVPSVLNSNGDPIVGTRGMSLRDYFAAKAMQGLCVNNTVSQDMAKAAYAMADAMLKERKK